MIWTRSKSTPCLNDGAPSPGLERQGGGNSGGKQVALAEGGGKEARKGLAPGQPDHPAAGPGALQYTLSQEWRHRLDPVTEDVENLLGLFPLFVRDLLQLGAFGQDAGVGDEADA